MRAFSYACSLLVMWQRWQSYHSIHHSGKSHAAHKLHGCMFYRTRVIADRRFSTFWLVWPWPWPDDHIWTWPYSLEINCTCKNELPKSTLSKVIVRQTDIQTWPKLYTKLLCGWSITTTRVTLKCKEPMSNTMKVNIWLPTIDSMTWHDLCCTISEVSAIQWNRYLHIIVINYFYYYCCYY